MGSDAAVALSRRQERIGGIVWGLTLMAMGTLFALESLGGLDIGAAGSHYAAARAVDGNLKTRWSSEFSDPQWLSVDLGERRAIARVRLDWEAAHAVAYQIQLSDDGRDWATAVDVRDGHGGTEEHEITASARFVRMYGTRRATPWGYSLRELSVFGPGGQLLSRDRSARSSSREGYSSWLVFWPLLLIAAGLPALIAPKDPGNQVMGAILTGIGVVLQGRTLGFLPWNFNQTLAVLLILTGGVLVLQALRRRGVKETSV